MKLDRDDVYNCFANSVEGGYATVAKWPLKNLARQIAELRRDARQYDGGEPDGLGSSMEIARAIREHARESLGLGR